jgi:hypothetical protein
MVYNYGRVTYLSKQRILELRFFVATTTTLRPTVAFMQKVKFVYLLSASLILIFSNSEATAQSARTLPYLSRQTLYKFASIEIDLPPHRNMRVPVDYSSHKSGTTPIYYWYPSNFDPKLPTVIEFPGGPGYVNQNRQDYLGLNVIRFDYRGLRFSRPDNIAES